MRRGNISELVSASLERGIGESAHRALFRFGWLDAYRREPSTVPLSAWTSRALSSALPSPIRSEHIRSLEFDQFFPFNHRYSISMTTTSFASCSLSFVGSKAQAGIFEQQVDKKAADLHAGFWPRRRDPPRRSRALPRNCFISRYLLRPCTTFCAVFAC